jgi:hypothetical protein
VILACKRAGIKISATEAYSHVCEACNLAKARILTSHMPSIPLQRPLALIYFDNIPNKLGYGFKRHTVHAVDAYSRFHWIGHTNDEAGQTVGEFCISMVKRLELQTCEKLQAVQLDNDTEIPDFVRFFKYKEVAVRPQPQIMRCLDRLRK